MGEPGTARRCALAAIPCGHCVRQGSPLFIGRSGFWKQPFAAGSVCLCACVKRFCWLGGHAKFAFALKSLMQILREGGEGKAGNASLPGLCAVAPCFSVKA